MNRLPIFRTQYSIGKGILTLEKEGKSLENGPDSVIDIAKEQKLKEILVVDDSMSGYLVGMTNCKEAGIRFNFGLRLTVCDDIEQKNEESKQNEHKVIIFGDNTDKSYKSLIKIYSTAACDGKYYYPRIDLKTLKSFWNSSLKLAIPFYDSFLFQNILTFANCNPDFSFAGDPIFFHEENGTVLDKIISPAVKKYCKSNKFPLIETKTIYYKQRKDFKAYLTLRCICNSRGRSTLECPNIEHMCSDEFCVESLNDFPKGNS